MPYSTRRNQTSADPPAQAPTQAAKRGPGRKRKADEPTLATATSDQVLTPTPPNASRSASKRKKTSAAQLPSPTEGSNTDTVVNPTPIQVPAPPSSRSVQDTEPVATDFEPAPVPSAPSAGMSATNSEVMTEAQPEPHGSSTPAPGPGENTRNRDQRAPNLREQNTALSKANEELEGTCLLISLTIPNPSRICSQSPADEQ